MNKKELITKLNQIDSKISKSQEWIRHLISELSKEENTKKCDRCGKDLSECRCD